MKEKIESKIHKMMPTVIVILRTMMAYSKVSFFVGQVTFFNSTLDSLKKSMNLDIEVFNFFSINLNEFFSW